MGRGVEMMFSGSAMRSLRGVRRLTHVNLVID
jgi:hypothetical protein